jgi:DNA-binding transcriptional ArsR family regulator
MSITRLTAGTDVTRQAVTKHLQILAGAGLVRGRRQGRQSLWELEPRRLDAARRYLDLISKNWDDTLGRLKAALED